MKNHASTPASALGAEANKLVPASPASASPVSLDVMFRARLLDPPSHPGLLACLDKYEIVRMIGRGGMGVVFLAQEMPLFNSMGKSAYPASFGTPQTGARMQEQTVGQTTAAGVEKSPKWVAIKLLRPEFLGNTTDVQRFLTEALHMQRLAHPHIIKVLEISGQSPSVTASPQHAAPEEGLVNCPVLKPQRPYFVMPYIERGNLGHLLRDKEPLPEALVIKLSLQVAAALCFVHERGIIHRDLNPANILVDDEGQAYLTDFGLSRTQGNDASIDVRLPQRMGTACYMSPAVAAGEAEDTRCDIYSFGAVLYAMLTGQPPLEQPSTIGTHPLNQNGEPKAVLSINPKANSELARIAEKAMACKLSERYARMADLVADLERVQQQQGSAGPLSEVRVKTPPVNRLGLLARKRYIVALGIALFIVLAGWFLAHPVMIVTRTINLAGVFQWNNARLGDWDGDGRPEIIFPHYNRLLTIPNQGELNYESGIYDPNNHDLKLDMVCDVDGDKIDELFMQWPTGTNLSIAMFKHRNQAKLFRNLDSSLPTAKGKDFTSHFVAKKVIDLNHNGSRELLAVLSTDHDQEPQGLYCYNFENETLLWRYLTEVKAGQLAFLDLSGDGSLSVIMGSQTLDYDDDAGDAALNSRSYLYALTGKTTLSGQDATRLLWKRELGGPHTQTVPLIADLHNNGTPSILAWVTHDSADLARTPEKGGRIVEFDRQGNILGAFESPGNILSCMVVDLHNDGQKEIIYTDDTGTIGVLNDKFVLQQKQIVRPKQLETTELRIVGVEDLNGDKAREIVLMSSHCKVASALGVQLNAGSPRYRVYHDNEIIVLSARLRELAHHLIPGVWKEQNPFSVQIGNWNGRSTPDILCFAQEVRVLHLGRGFGPFTVGQLR